MVDTCVSTGLPTPEFVEDRDYLVVRFARPIKAEGRLDDAEIVLSMIRNNPEIRQADTVEANRHVPFEGREDYRRSPQQRQDYQGRQQQEQKMGRRD